MIPPPHPVFGLAQSTARKLWTFCRSLRLPRSRRGRVTLSLAVVYFVWGSTYLGVHVALESFPPLLLSGSRNLLAGIGLFVFAMRRRPARPTLLQVRNAGVVGAVLVGFSGGMLAYGMRTVGTGTAAIIVATVPLFAMVIAAATGHHIARAEWGAVALGLVGIGVLSHGGTTGTAGGSLAVLCGALFWAIGAHLAGKLELPSDLFLATAVQIGLGGAISTLVAWVSGERMMTLHFLPVLAFLYLMLAGTMAGFVAYGYLIRHTSPLVASSCMYVNPVVAVALGALLLGEPVTTGTIIAMVLILGSVALSFLFDDRRRGV
ncbi:EamA family transporter [Paraburkholderia dinghuensis]|uniref:EamA family transporter n=1 Tax=Paraburkholderia dinghuensis TaxID=2305225 RepID=A0A3N6MVJ9_9BURK|nr:EamA family transporter [Paraburkholderia dinghuensis]RQH07759.1 EamA family transporter [Paraburkholderia dinghuensis]